MNIKEIIQKHLRENGFDGLFNDYAECGCKTDDLVPCDCVNINDCEPGYLRPETDEFEWTIGPKED